MSVVKIEENSGKCPCGGQFDRFATIDASTEFFCVHYDICCKCGFKTYAYNDNEEKLKRYKNWK